MFWLFIAAVNLGVFALIGWFSHIRNQKFKVAVQAKTERFNKIIDRFSDEGELLAFLQSERGLTILNTLTTSTRGTQIPIIVTASAGLVALFIGLGALFITLTVENDLIFGAVFMSAIGLGLLTAAAFSYRLGRKWGLFEDRHLHASESIQMKLDEAVKSD